MNSLQSALTVNIDEHVLYGALPQIAQTGYTVQFPSVIRPRPMDGEAFLDVKGDLFAVHLHLRRRVLAVQSHLRLGRRHLAGQDRRPVGSQLNHLVVVRRGNK